MTSCQHSKFPFKICCISSLEEAGMAMRYGATALGLVSEMPSGPGVISEARIARIVKRVPPDVHSVLLTCKMTAKEIVGQVRRSGASTVQIVDALPEDELIQVREQLPFTTIFQVIHVLGESSITEALAVEKHVDAILLDSGNPSLSTKELGGTGRVHDWAISRKLRESVKVPVYLAGGLNPENVADAIRLVKPYAVDICSGVRTDGALDEKKLAAFVHALTHAQAHPHA